MKVKNIKFLVKILITTTIISFSMINICFANDGLYAKKATVDSNGNTIIEYSDDSWYSYNNSANSYMFKEFNKDIIKFNCLTDFNNYVNIYKNDRETTLFNNDSNSVGFKKHSEIFYSDDLSTDDKLKQYAEKWLKYNYYMEIDIPIYFSSCLQNNNNGKFTYDGDKPIDIKINANLKNMSLVTEKVLVHELTHYALFVQDKEFDDGTNTFSTECVNNGGNTNDGKVGLLSSHLECTKCNIMIK